MRMLFLAAGVATLAISAPSIAKPDGDKGGGRAKAEKSERGGGERRAERKAERGNDRRVERKAERGNERRAERRQERAKNERRAERRQERARDERRAERRQERVRDERRAERRQDRVRDERRAERRVERDRDDRVRVVRADRNDRRDDRRERLVELRDRDRDFRFRDDDRRDRRFAARGLPVAFLDGCPPGLRDKNEWCLPPGQYKKAVGQRLPRSYASQLLPLSLRDLYRDDDDYYWRYGDGYAYRVDRDRDLISSILPLIGAGFGIGMPFPYSSPNYYVPSYYQPFYQDSPYSYHRYANGYVYEIDRRTGLIDGMIPLLDHGYGVGQMLPASYSYYNLPYQYRDYYRDDDDYFYRYAPGSIYQVDRDTQLITAIVSLLTGNNRSMMVGQPLPLGYDAYNVPYAYRDRYYDTPDSWYRYSNGYIYQVDPTTRLITAAIDAIV